MNSRLLIVATVTLLHLIGSLIYVVLSETVSYYFFLKVVFALAFYLITAFSPVFLLPVDVESCSLKQDDEAPSLRSCPKCSLTQPNRSKHCLYCHRCVERYDHHCFWLGNCIGGKNHFWFVILLFCESLAISEFLAVSMSKLFVGPDLFGFSILFFNFLAFVVFFIF
ncbi:hypothetical protein GEMRC1_008888 [Eukaryota sp. GEM-RC1]